MSRPPPKRGRPPRNEKNKTILLRESTFNLWNQKKIDLGFQGNTNSEFAEFLLHSLVQWQFEEERARMDDGAEVEKNRTAANSGRSLIHSTPAKAEMAALTRLSLSPVIASNVRNESLASSIDDNNDASMPTHGDELETSVISQALNKVNPLYASILGQPFEGQGIDMSSESSSTDSSDESADEFSDESYNYRSDEETMSVYDDSSTKTAFDTFLEFADNSSPNQSQAAHSSLTAPVHLLLNESVEPSGEPKEDATKMQGPEDVHASLQKELSQVFAELIKCDDELAKYVQMANEERVIVETTKVLDLFNGKCQVEKCSGERKVIRHSVDGGVLSVSYRCSGGHAGVWYSSSVLTEKRGQKVFVTSVLLSSAVLLTGNNFDKVELMAKMLRLAFVSSSTFNRIQTLHAVPAVKELWEKMKEQIWQTFQDQDLVLCGDARMDSPGFSAKYCAYILMDHYLDIITDLEVVDKREAGGTSTIMEKMALKRLMERIIEKLKIKEVVTDASSTIMKLLRDMKDQNPESMSEFFHSLDVWHKSCKLTAKLTSASKTRGCEGIKQWIEPVRNHFWHCAENCNGDEAVLKDMWLGVMHHVCNEHEWSDGQCSHGPLTPLEEGKEYLSKESKSAQAMREVIYDPQWLNTLKFYVYFRHTSRLESFNSMVLKYAPKRIGFAYEIFLCRILLAALDHNFHAFRELIEGRYKRVYSKRSKNWHVVPVKEDKSYKYWDILLSKILKARADDNNSVVRHVEVSPTNPQNLAPTIAMREPPATKDLVEAKLSRFKSKE